MHAIARGLAVRGFDVFVPDVSEPKREYLWILSRSPAVDNTRYAALLGRLTAIGLDVGKLEKTVQGKP
jgi:apolipoprotein D and lipocalin family protein